MTLGESHEHEELTELAGRDDPDPTLVALTPIGLWAVRELLLEQGVPRRWSASWRGRTSSTCACGWPGCARMSGRPSWRRGWRRAARARRRTSWRACCVGRMTPRTALWRCSALRRNGERRDGELRSRDRDLREAGPRPVRGPRTGPLPVRTRAVRTAGNG